MITKETIIKPIPPGVTAIQVAAACYTKWMGQVSFEADVAEYLANGVVISMPSCFGLARVIKAPDTGEPAWFVRMAAGRLDELLYRLPYYLPKICFCRKNDGRMRCYSLERVIKLATRKGD
jgi:hypothetical protein